MEVVVGFNDASADFLHHGGVLRLGIRAERWRVNRIEEANLQMRKAAEFLASWPGSVEAFERDGDDRTLIVNGENRSPLAKSFGLAIDAAFTFGKEHQHPLLTQAICASAHGGHEVGVRVDDDEAELRGQPAHKAAAENFAVADVEAVAHDGPRQAGDKDGAVDIALVVGGDDERVRGGKLVNAFQLEMEEIAQHELGQAQ